MTIFDTFVQSSMSLEDEKEDQAIQDWFYREEEPNDITITTLVSRNRYGKGYGLLRNMGYAGHGPLIDSPAALIEPLSHTNGHKNRDTTGLGYIVGDGLPIYDLESTTSSDSEDKNQLATATTKELEDFMPPTSILWEIGEVFYEHNDEASSSQQYDNSDVEDPNRDRINRNISRLIERESESDSADYEWESPSIKSIELGVDTIHSYANHTNVVNESPTGLDGLNLPFAFVNHTSSPRAQPNLGTFDNDFIGFDFPIIGDDSFHINAIEASTSLPLIH